MTKNILILTVCLLIAGLSLFFFQNLGNYAFLIMIVITFLALISRVKPKFGNENKDE
jgi:hypothetical protein